MASCFGMFNAFIVIGLLFCSTLFSSPSSNKVELGVDVFFSQGMTRQLKGKRVALVTNHTGVNKKLRSTIDLFLDHRSEVNLVTLFSPEHGLKGHAYAFESVEHEKGPDGIAVYNLQGATRRPTEQMLKGIDVIVYDIQDLGSRAYTYATTLFYVMEEAAKRKIKVIVLDRPNPINGLVVDGPMLEEKWRSYIGYVNVPYCHGMTIGELASFFNDQYRVGCNLQVVPMKGWERSMSFKDTGLTWIPTSPYVPEADTPLFYASTGIIGELSLVNIGIGYTLPFKVIGAPWINAQTLADQLNAQKLPGTLFVPFHYRPFYGLYKGKDCQGVMIVVSDPKVYRPATVQYMMLGILKNLYPKEVQARIQGLESTKKSAFCKANGNEKMYQILLHEKYTAWKLILFQKEERQSFQKLRAKYLLY